MLHLLLRRELVIDPTTVLTVPIRRVQQFGSELGSRVRAQVEGQGSGRV